MQLRLEEVLHRLPFEAFVGPVIGKLGFVCAEERGEFGGVDHGVPLYLLYFYCDGKRHSLADADYIIASPHRPRSFRNLRTYVGTKPAYNAPLFRKS